MEEADEAKHWLRVLDESGIAAGPELRWLDDEAHRLRAIFKASLDTSRANYLREKPNKS